MSSVPAARMDKTQFTVGSLADEGNPQADLTYWLSRPPHERLQAVELLRQIHYGYDPATERLQRVLVILRR